MRISDWSSDVCSSDLGAVAGTQEQGLSATFRRSNAGRRDRTVQAGLELLHEDYKSYSAYTAALRGSISRSSTPIFQTRWTWSYGFELLASAQTTVTETPGATKRPKLLQERKRDGEGKKVS